MGVSGGGRGGGGGSCSLQISDIMFWSASNVIQEACQADEGHDSD